MLNINKLFTKNNKNNFNTMYPLLVEYITDENSRKSLTNNNEFYTKYNGNITLITALIFELKKYHDKEYITNIIQMEVVLLDTNTLRNLIEIYLNSSDEVKSDDMFFVNYNMKHNLASISPELKESQRKIDDEYHSSKTGNEKFNEINLDELYNTLDYQSRKYVADLLFYNESYNSWDIFKSFFEERYEAHFKSLIKLLNSKGIDYMIFNNNLKVELNENYPELVFNLLSEKNNKSSNTIKKLINQRKYNLILRIVTNKVVDEAYMIDDDSFKDVTTDDDIVRKLVVSKTTKKR